MTFTPSNHNYNGHLSFETRKKIQKVKESSTEHLGVAAILYAIKDAWYENRESKFVFYAEESKSEVEHVKRRAMDKKQQKRLKKIFQRYASHKDPVSGAPLMTPEDFIQSILERSDHPSDSSRAKDSQTLRLLFQMADTKETGMINFSEYVILFKLLTTPESEFEMAFRMFDLNNDGSISKEEFKQALKGNKYVSQDFDFDCDLMARFFGRDGHSTLSYHQFSQFMRLLTEEIRRQEFQRMDTDKDGYITAEQFGQLLTNYIPQSGLPQKNSRKH
jgi:Ca2+-binding EF-hand superfamily protein